MTTPSEPRPTYGMPNLPTGVARLPIPGNAEFLLYVAALVVAMLVCWISDSMDASTWFNFFEFTTVAYILSRGIAKASRVLEQ